MQNIDDEIRSKTEAFAKELAVLVRRAALESVSAALGAGAASLGGGAAQAPVAVKRGRGRPKKVVAQAPAAKAPVAKAPAAAKAAPASKAPAKAAPASKAPAAKKAAPAKRPLGAKRPPAELAKLTESLGDYIKSHPGLRIEPIGKALSTPTKELNLPIKKLLAAKKIRSEGHKRATEYYPA
jgi:nucleoid-associated protein YgaU